jgi:hypothetical protein
MADLMEAGVKVAPQDFAVRIGEEELGRILNLKENLEHCGILVRYAARYQRLGWALVGMNGQGADDLGLDFSRPEAEWSGRLADLSLEKTQVNLAIRTGPPSQLMVLEVHRGQGEAALDRGGEWRAECIAMAGNVREQHYYALEPHWRLPPSGFLDGPQVMVFSEGGLVLTPPSQDPRDRESLRWLQPPWSSPPRPPGPAVWQFLREHLNADLGPEAGGAVPGPAALASWEEIFQTISIQEAVMRTFLAPAASAGEYYRCLLQAALAAGLRKPGIILGLLWHAPQWGGRHRPERWHHLENLVTAALKESASGTDAWRRDLEENLADLQEDFQGSFERIRSELEQSSGAAEPLSGQDLTAFQPRKGDEPGAAVQAGCPGGEQIIQPLAELISFMKDRVIVERGRYEAMLFELGKLSSKNEDLERRIAASELASPLPEPSLPSALEPPPAAIKMPVTSGSDLAGGEEKLTTAIFQAEGPRQPLSEVRQAVDDFLSQNSDLASEERKIKMVDYCLKYYINNNKELAGLPLRERLARSGKMARSFLTA